MNPYSPDIIENDVHFDVAIYSINRHSHEETLATTYIDHNSQKKGIVYFFKKAAIHTSIMEILDYDKPEREPFRIAFQKLQSTLPLLGIDRSFDEKAFNHYCSRCTTDDIVSSAGKIMPILQACFAKQPALSYLYPLYYDVMRSCYLQAGREADAKLLRSAELLSQEVKTLHVLYTQARNYLHDVMITPAEQRIQLPSSVIAETYHSYCLYADKQNLLSDALFDMEIKSSFLPDSYFMSAAHIKVKGWLEYLCDNSAFIKDKMVYKHPITSFKQFLYLGIRQMLEDELIIRKCKLCNGYFRVKYTSNQEYCTRIYKDTSTTCNEYASRKSYKERLFSHPIHTEFTKSYNRLYARIRRGKLSADTPLMRQLKELHDEYTEKYENTHQKDREAVWKEYIKRNKDLLKPDNPKS